MSRILKWLPNLGSSSDSEKKLPKMTPSIDSMHHPNISQCKRLLAWYRQGSNSGDQQLVGSSQQLLKQSGTTTSVASSSVTSGNFLIGSLNGGLVDAGRPTSGLWKSSALIQGLLGLTDAVFLHEVQKLMASSRNTKSSQYVGRSPTCRGGNSSSSPEDSLNLRWSSPDVLECFSELTACCIELHASPSGSGGTATGGETLDAIKLFTLIHFPAAAAAAQSNSSKGAVFSPIDWNAVVVGFDEWMRRMRGAAGDGHNDETAAAASDQCLAESIARIGCILLDELAESQACGLLRCLATAFALLLRAGDVYGVPDASWVAFDDSAECAEQLSLRLLDLFHEQYIESFVRWATGDEMTSVERQHQGSTSTKVIRRLVRELIDDSHDVVVAEGSNTGVAAAVDDELLRAAQELLTSCSGEGQTSTANVAAAFILCCSKRILRFTSDAEKALQLVADCLLSTSSAKHVCTKLSERLWCHHAACLRECSSLEASTALTREAYEGAMIELRTSCSRSFSSLLSALEYGKAYHDALYAVAQRQLSVHGNKSHHALTARWRSTVTLLCECRATWERCVVLLMPQQRWQRSDGGEMTLLDVIPELGHVEMPHHCRSSHCIRPLILHWGDYRRLMQLHVWLTEATADALIMLQMSIPQSNSLNLARKEGSFADTRHHAQPPQGSIWPIDEKEGQELRTSSRHLHLETNVWLDGLVHPRWGLKSLLAMPSIEWAEMETGMRRGVLLFNYAGFENAIEESIEEWEKVLQSVWLMKASTPESQRNGAAVEFAEENLRITHTASRLQVNLSQGLIALAEREGGIEKNKKLLTDALNYAYQAKVLTAPFARTSTGTTTANPRQKNVSRSDEYHRSLHHTHLLAAYLVCSVLSILRQYRKAVVMTEELKDSIQQFYRLRCCVGGGTQDDQKQTGHLGDPIAEALLVDATVLHASCLSKSTTDSGSAISARDLADQAETLLVTFVATWFEPSKLSSATTKRRDALPPRGECLTPLALGTLLFEARRRLEHGAAIQICLVRGETFASQRRWEDALVHFSQAFDLSQRSQQPVVEVSVMQHLGRCYRELDQTQMAIGYAKQAVDVAKEINGNQVLWYRASTFLANFLCDLDRRSEASELWEGILAQAQKFGDCEVERSTAKNMITLLMRGNQYYEAITAAETLEKACLANKEGSSTGKDRLFALETIATAYIAVGEIKKSLDIIDKMELLEDTDVAAHDTANQLRSQALLAQREDHAAIDVIVEWKQRAKSQKNNGELLKATFALAEVLANVSLADAKAEYSAVLELCHEMHEQLNGPDELLTQDQRELGSKAARWLIHAFHLNDDVLEVQEVEEDEHAIPDHIGEQDNGSGEHQEETQLHDNHDDIDDTTIRGEMSPHRLDENAQGNPQEDDGNEEDDDLDLGALRRAGGSSYGAGDFEFDHDEDPEASCGVDEDDADSDAVNRIAAQSQEGAHQQRRLFSHDDMTRTIIDENSIVPPKVVSDIDDDDDDDRVVALVRCFNPQLAIEVNDSAARLLCPHGVLPVYRSPKTVVDVCLSSLPNATFVFYFLDYSTSSSSMMSPTSSLHKSSSSNSWVAPMFQYDVVVRPAGTPFFYTRTVSVDNPLADYHRRRPLTTTSTTGSSTPRGSSNSSSSSNVAAESDGTEYLYANLRALYDALWEPVARISSTSNMSHQSDCVVVVPHPTLLHVPFGALVSPKRKAVGQRACVVVSPGLSHLAFHTTGPEDDGILTLPRKFGVFESWLAPDELSKFDVSGAEDQGTDCTAAAAAARDKFLFLNSDTSALLSTGVTGGSSTAAASGVSSSATSASSFFAVPRQGGGGVGGRSGSGGSPFGELKNCVSRMQLSVVHGGTRKELLAAFASNATRCIAVLSDSPPERSGGGALSNQSQQQQQHNSSGGSASTSGGASASGGVFRMADGDVHLSELTALRKCCSDQLELVVVTNDRRHQPSIFDLGSAARLCTVFNCKRVLRVDVVGGQQQPVVKNSSGGGGGGSSSSCITHQHVLMIQLFLYFVHVALSNGLQYPYAVALQAAQAEAIRQYSLPPHIWGGITLVGTP
ncbi:Hypothetical protein, putative [Bodo saltans]|uniref:Uncharacterized protein n=1 Tax=Bodo saltans TaxID=75058 RepID=A0A0S4JIN8_BODSA|nr:Hypothetical protein, putative [Bodo saltans]|eukprot:CUG90029.1 Hypothetical protein, putative [Bodo saltans]